MTSLEVQPLLLRFPAEIRQTIYQLLLVLIFDTDSDCFAPLAYERDWKRQGSMHPAILRTCRKINAEASATLYGKNRFTFHGSSGFLQFVNSIGEVNASLVRDVQLLTRVPVVKIAEMKDALALVSGLRTIHISSHTMSCAGPAIFHIIKFYQAMKPLLERHPSLQRVLSKWPRGHMYSKRLNPSYRPWQAIVVTFAAENASVSSEEKPFELGAAVAEMEEQLEEITERMS